MRRGFIPLKGRASTVGYGGLHNHNPALLCVQRQDMSKPPASGQPKCQFYETDLRPGFVAALHLEKGLDSAIAEAFTSSQVENNLMDEDWAWHDFADLLRDGELFETVHGIAADTEAEICFNLLGGYMDDPDEFDPRDPDSLIKWDESLHVWMPGLKKLKLVRYRARSEALGKLNFSFQPEEYTDVLLTAAESAWTWIDVRVGMAFLPAEGSRGEGTGWTGEKIWDGLLEPLLRLLT